MNLKYSIIIFIVSLGIIAGCAKIGSISGGPKDNTPPKVVSSKPKDGTTNFKDKKVEITFDEFIKFEDQDKWFVTSPPFKKKPDVILKYKTVEVNFEEDLIPNTTYTLNFGNSITDNNEGNPIRDYEFVFSTGDYIDSLSFEGQILNAYSHKPDKDGLFVMLYDQLGDSVPFKSLPVYTSKTNEKGFFRVNHLKPDTFRVLAVKDANKNFLYDTNEDIAFSDSLLFLNNSFFRIQDSTSLAKDTASNDSVYYSQFKPQMVLFSFNNETKKQYLSKKERPNANQLFFKFNAPLDTFRIHFADTTVKSPWYLKEENEKHDSIALWITDTTLIKKDTLKTVLTYPVPDSMNILHLKYDTLTLITKIIKEQRRSKNKKAAAEVLTLKTNAIDGFDLNKNLTVEADEPLDSVNFDKIYFTYTEDSVYKPVKYTYQKDSVNFRKFEMKFKPIPSAKYSLIFDSLAIASIYKTRNDSTGITFTAQKDDFYGTIKATLSNINSNVILEVLSETESLIKSYTIKENKLLTIDFLAPGKYILKAIIDRNGNGQWDAGDYIKKLQPEKVEYYQEIVPVRSNWDVEVNWEIGKDEKITPLYFEGKADNNNKTRKSEK
jgi:hypothetical protein